MSPETARGAVTTSALIVAGVFMYRHFTDTATSKKNVTTDQFLLGWMVIYLVLSATAQAAPALGAMFAWLIALGDVLINGQGLITDLNKGLGKTAAATK